MINCKRGVTLRSTAEWEKKTHPHTHIPTHPHARTRTHTLTYRGSNKPYLKKGQKGQKKNKNRVNTVKNLKKGTQCFNVKFHQPSLQAKRTGKKRKIIVIIQQTSMRCNGSPM